MSQGKPNVKRRIIPSDSDLEDMEMPVLKLARIDSMYDLDAPQKVSAKSFYGSGTKKYLNPLERKDIPASRRHYSTSPPQDENKNTKKKSSGKPRKKTGKNAQKNAKPYKVNPLREVIPGSSRSPVKNVMTTAPETTNEEGEAPQVPVRKFFKTRNAAGLRASPPGTRLGVVIKRGFKLTFKATKGETGKKKKTGKKYIPLGSNKSSTKKVKPSLSFVDSTKRSKSYSADYSNRNSIEKENNKDGTESQPSSSENNVADGEFREKELSMGLDCDSDTGVDPQEDDTPFWPPSEWSDRASASSGGTDSVLLLTEASESSVDSLGTPSNRYTRKSKLMEGDISKTTSPSRRSPRKHPRIEAINGLDRPNSFSQSPRKSPRKRPWNDEIKIEKSPKPNNPVNPGTSQRTPRKVAEEGEPGTLRRTPRKVLEESSAQPETPRRTPRKVLEDTGQPESPRRTPRKVLEKGSGQSGTPQRTPRKVLEKGSGQGRTLPGIPKSVQGEVVTQPPSSRTPREDEHIDDVMSDKSETDATCVMLRRSPRKAKPLDENKETPGKSPKKKSDKIGTSEKKYFPIFGPKSSPASQGTPKWSGKHSPLLQNLSRHRSPNPLKALAKADKDGKEQMILDCGQKVIGATQCQSCGMTYSIGEPMDEAMHSKFHQRFANTLRFPGYKNERVVQEFPDGCRVVSIMHGEKAMMKKVEAVKKIVDEDLGFVAASQPVPRQSTVYLFISDEKKIIGFCIAEQITQAYRVIPNSPAKSQECAPDRTRAWCCKEEPEPAKCGINRIWVLGTERRRKVATKLLECIRGHFLMGYPLGKSDLAFTDPTPDGKCFATKFTGTRSFLVYKR